MKRSDSCHFSFVIFVFFFICCRCWIWREQHECCMLWIPFNHYVILSQQPNTTDLKGLAFTINITLPVLVKSFMFYGEVLAEIMGVLLYVTFHWNIWHPSCEVMNGLWGSCAISRLEMWLLFRLFFNGYLGVVKLVVWCLMKAMIDCCHTTNQLSARNTANHSLKQCKLNALCPVRIIRNHHVLLWRQVTRCFSIV